MQVLPIERLSNDLFAEVNCSCCNPKYKDNKVLKDIMKTKISLTGYSDSYFFDVVNKEPKKDKCRVCGREYEYQWTRKGVNFRFLPKSKKVADEIY